MRAAVNGADCPWVPTYSGCRCCRPVDGAAQVQRNGTPLKTGSMHPCIGPIPHAQGSSRCPLQRPVGSGQHLGTEPHPANDGHGSPQTAPRHPRQQPPDDINPTPLVVATATITNLIPPRSQPPPPTHRHRPSAPHDAVLYPHPEPTVSETPTFPLIPSHPIPIPL